ncbi:MAG: glycosyltransferase [Lachnospiraceae bacterium]|nr:glycosyltransferase [Lachnospiraceae bacterium]
MMKVSIIMPVYNSEKYLRKAVDSVVGQDFDDFELILVDDGSPDNSGKICDEYAEKYDKVKVIHKENGGICSARNAGLRAATGEYVGFCDNDDEYLPDLIKDNYTLAKENNVDLLRYAKIKRLEKDNGKIWESVTPLRDIFIEKDEFYKHYDNIRREDTVWTGLYRRSIITEQGICFDETFKSGWEDFNFNLKFLKHCQRLGFNSKAYYSWTQRESHSTSRSFKREFIDKNMINIQLEYEFMQGPCEGKVNNVVKNVFLTNSYIHSIVDYMSIKNCDLTLKEKCQQLDMVRNHPIFDQKLSKRTAKTIKKRNYRMYLTMKLFYDRRYKTLLFVLDKGTAILAKFRFKKVK